MKTIIKEENVKDLGYKNLRGLKMGISRKLGKGKYKMTKWGLQIDSIDLISVVAKKISNKKLRELLGAEEDGIDTRKIIKKVDKKITEIKIRQGDFYVENDCENSPFYRRGVLLAQMFVNEEVTEEEFTQTVQDYSLDVDINFKKILSNTYKKFIDDTYSSSYSNYNSNSKKNTYSTVDEEEFQIENFYNEINGIENKEEKRLTKDTIKMSKNYIITPIFDYCGECSICIFERKNKELIAHYYIRDINFSTDINSIKDVDKNIRKLKILDYDTEEILKIFEQMIGSIGLLIDYYKKENEIRKAKLREDERKREKKEQEEKEKYKKYEQENKDNWNDFFNENYNSVNPVNFNNEEKRMLKKCYKTLALKFHPDTNSEGSEIMKFINSKLKVEWGI